MTHSLIRVLAQLEAKRNRQRAALEDTEAHIQAIQRLINEGASPEAAPSKTPSKK